MTTITLEIPDELATRIKALREPLPNLLARALEPKPKPFANAPTVSVYDETLDFIFSGPTPQQIVEFKASLAVQERLEDLLDKKREAELDEDEAAELAAYEQVDDLMILLKARARAFCATSN